MSDLNQTIQFVDSSLPPIKAGQYTLEVTQKITDLDTAEILGEYPATKKKVYVQGNRLSIDPLDIDSVFPPEGGAGDYGNVLPHVTFSRKTLPWEQDSGVPKARAPWLALLVFHEKDEGGIPQIRPAMVGDLLREDFRSGETLSHPVRPSTLVSKECESKLAIATYTDAAGNKPWKRPGENDWDPCLVVDVSVKLFHEIAPTQADLPWLAHSRIDSSPSGPREYSAVIANRLALREGVSMACLVSFEGMAYFLAPAPSIMVNGKNATHVRLVVLKAWNFRSGADLLGFYREISSGPLKLPYDKPASETPEDIKVRNALAMGYTALDHNTRWGDRAISWYRGPFLPFSSEVTRSVPLPPINEEGYLTGTTPLSSADEALRYDPELGMLDVSYAVAWQLGRLMALRDETFSYDLYHWKRENKQKIIQPIAADVFAILADLMNSFPQTMNPMESARNLINDLDRLKKHLEGAKAPESVVRRLDKLRRLEGVPMDYLVPDERMFPPESLRFFQVDPNWIYSLIEGAYSIARVSTSDQKQDTATCPHNVYKQISGFLLRSAVVSGWPTLQVRVEVSNASDISELRCQRITPDILLYLIEVEGQGVITSVTLQVPPESIEFHLPGRKGVPFRAGSQSVIDIHALAQKEITPAQFARKLAAVFSPPLAWDNERSILSLKFEPVDDTNQYEWQFLVNGKPFLQPKTIKAPAGLTPLVEVQLPLSDDLPAGEIAVRIRPAGTARRINTGRWVTSTTLHRPRAYDAQPMLKYRVGEDWITAEWPSSSDSVRLEAQLFHTSVYVQESKPFGAVVKFDSPRAPEPIRAVLKFDDGLEFGRVQVRFRPVALANEKTLPAEWAMSTQSLIRLQQPIFSGPDSYVNGVHKSVYYDLDYNISVSKDSTLEMYVLADPVYKVRETGRRVVFTLKPGDIRPGTYPTRARVIGQDDHTISSCFTQFPTFVTLLGRPTVTVSSASTLSWNKIDGAVRFLVVLKDISSGDGRHGRLTAVDASPAPSLDISSLILFPGTYQAYVTPQGEWSNFTGPVSEPVVVTIKN